MVVGVLTLPFSMNCPKSHQVCQIQEEGVGMRRGNAKKLRVSEMIRGLETGS